MRSITAIGFESELLSECAHALAAQLNLIVNNTFLPRLSFTSEKLVLLMEGFSPLFVDFNALELQKRRDGGKKQGLVRACKPQKGVRILDATAGWGRDAGVLAGFGAEVTMVERHPVMAALLADGLSRLPAESSLVMKVVNMDAKAYLQALNPDDYPDVIYIDPMHPIRQKSALVKKDTQALQQVIGTDNDAADLIQIARARAKQRVVVKWPQRLAPLFPPTSKIEGKTVRFDVYAIPKR